MPRKVAPEPVLSTLDEEAAFRLKLATVFLATVQDWKRNPDPGVVPSGDEIPSIVDSYHPGELDEDFFLCYGCKARATGGKLYCDDPLCQQLGNTVRHVRKGLANGKGSQELFLSGVGQELLSDLQGGYDPYRRISTALRNEILRRDNNTCQRCGKPGGHVDHILGSSNDPSNLRVLCADCNMLRAFTPAVIADAELDEDAKEFQENLWLALVQRVGSEVPLLMLDRSDWSNYSRKIAAHRRKIHQQRLDDVDADGFEDVDDYLYNAMQKDD